VTSQVGKAVIKRRIHVEGACILIMGFTFKENCPDLRNTRVIDIVREVADYNASVDVHDPWASAEEAQHEYGLALIEQPEPGAYDAIVLAVAHDEFRELGAGVRAFGKPEHVLYDLKYVLGPDQSDLRL